jgi:hypothetical protein
VSAMGVSIRPLLRTVLAKRLRRLAALGETLAARLAQQSRGSGPVLGSRLAQLVHLACREASSGHLQIASLLEKTGRARGVARHTGTLAVHVSGEQTAKGSAGVAGFRVELRRTLLVLHPPASTLRVRFPAASYS